MSESPPSPVPLGDTRSRIIRAAETLIAEGGSDAATTRAVAAAADVQPPAIYRLFGDKVGLLDAVAGHVIDRFVTEKSRVEPGPDPVEDLCRGWDSYVEFGLANPSIFALMVTAALGQPAHAAFRGRGMLRDHVRRVARAGRLKVTEEQAADLLHAMGTGLVLTLLEKPKEERGGLSELALAAVLASVVGGPAQDATSGVAGTASALRASIDELSSLTPGERHLLDELLARIARGRRASAPAEEASNDVTQ